MKTSPLTEEEIACIHEGLKHYKSDWMAVWQYVVPHRDPVLLPRQWRVALGTQKSYKLNSPKRAKRRLYESQRRKLKATTTECGQPVSDKEDGETEIADGTDYSNVPYVHQAFLADWRPDASTFNYSEHVSSTSVVVNAGHDSISQNIQLYRGTSNYGLSGNVQHQNGNQPAFPSAYKLPLLFHSTSDFRSGGKGAPSATIPNNPVFGATSSSKYYCRPYRARKANSARLVKLAPDLPPVNLPSSVRVVSQTAFKGFQCGKSKIYPPGGGVTDVSKDNSASQIPHGEKIGIDHRAKRARPMPKDSVIHSQLERSETAEGRSFVEEEATRADLQMHPLLFQGTEEGNTPYYPFKFSTSPSSSFSFFSGRQPQLNLSLFSSSQQEGHIDRANKSLKSKSSSLRLGGIDFHPLLQKSNDTQAQTGSDAIQAEPLVSGVLDTTNVSSGLNDKSNELDLEIHLSSVPESEKSMKSRQLKAHDLIESQKIVASCATAMNAPYCQQGGRIPSPSGGKFASSAPLVVPDDNLTRYVLDDVGEQSHPEIVMEQEELSDSEEDIEEHVEFECEEMADSEGEDGSGCEQTSEVQNKFECEEMSDSEEEDGSGCEKASEVQNK
ncbi:putative DUO pollen-like protein, partial [Trifolium pratense]